MLKTVLTHAFFVCAVATAAVSQSRADTRPLIFAAASLSEALTEISDTLEPRPRLSFGGSGAMARQIAQGAPADVIVLANPVWMDWLETRGDIISGTRHSPIGNALVVIGPPGAPALTALNGTALAERLGPKGRLAMGEQRAVPAGQYAAEWLREAGLWQQLRPRLAETENVRAALTLVARAEAPLGIVYRSDLIAAPDAASIVWTIPAEAQPDIRYAIAAVTERGRTLVDALIAPEALDTFALYGFTIRSAP